jgi:gas vesicle protein
MNTMNKVLIGALTGLTAGVAIGMLTAPEKGKDTRERIAKQMDKLKMKFNRMRGKENADLEELENIFTHEIDGLKDDVREKVLKLISAKRTNKVPEPSLS